MKKKKKKVSKMPPLSLIDRWIYWGAFLIIMAMDGLLVLFPFWNWYRNAFHEDTVVAVQMTAGVVWSFPGWFVFMVTTFILWYQAYEKRLPIFGKRNFRYGPPAWPKVYPLFMKDKPYVWVSEQTRTQRRRKAAALVILAVLSFVPYPLSWSGRICLNQDGSIRKYNVLNIQTRDYASREIEQVELRTYLNSLGKYHTTKIGDVEIILTTKDGRHYVFEREEFRGSSRNDRNDWLPAMMKLKNRYRPEIVTCTGAQLLEKIILDHQLTARQSQMLYELFTP